MPRFQKTWSGKTVSENLVSEKSLGFGRNLVPRHSVAQLVYSPNLTDKNIRVNQLSPSSFVRLDGHPDLSNQFWCPGRSSQFHIFFLSLWSERRTQRDPICLYSHFLCLFFFHFGLCGAFDIVPQLDVSHAISGSEGALFASKNRLIRSIQKQNHFYFRFYISFTAAAPVPYLNGNRWLT